MKLKTDKTLVYYDGEQVITATSENNTTYLLVLILNIPEGRVFMGTPVTPARLKEFETSKRDLRSIFTESETGEIIKAEFLTDEESNRTRIITDKYERKALFASCLPEEGFFL